MNPNPAAVVEVTRGAFVESSHKVDIVVSDADGKLVEVWGEPDRAIFPRSSVKALQALPLVESGAADAFGFEGRHLALACSSHHGEADHVNTAREMLQKIGLDETCLECGAQRPISYRATIELEKSDTDPSAIFNTCSGKHSGFLAFAKHTGLITEGYARFDSPVQAEIAGALEEVISSPHGKENYAIDGCSIPTYLTGLDHLAAAYAKFGVGNGGSALRSASMRRIRDACLDHPEMVAGDKGACTQIMRALGRKAFVKYGAEAVYTASLPELGYGIAMKARDGSPRAVEVAVATVIKMLLEKNSAQCDQLAPLCNPIQKNSAGLTVGSMRLVL